MKKPTKFTVYQEEETLHVKLSGEIKAALKVDADKRGVSMSGLVSSLLFDRYNPQPLKE